MSTTGSLTRIGLRGLVAGMMGTGIAAAANAQPTQLAKLYAADNGVADQFGFAVAIDDGIAVVGAPRDRDAGLFSGSAYIFRDTGGTWVQEAKIVADDAAASDTFGSSVAISDGTVVVGSPGDDDAGLSSGSAYIFREIDGQWQQIDKLVASGARQNDSFGLSVAIDGDAIVVGAPFDSSIGNLAGAVVVYQEIGGVWLETDELFASDAGASDRFGTSVSLADDLAIVGAINGDADPVSNSGAAYIFRQIDGQWEELTKITSDDAALGDSFGTSVAIDGDLAVIGADGNDDAGSFSGSAYIFQDTNGGWTQVTKILSDDLGSNDQFGNAVAVDERIVVVGARANDALGLNASGAAYVFRESGGVWGQDSKFTPDDLDANDQFGVSISLAGGTLVSGAIAGDSPTTDGTGAGYVFSLGSACEPDLNDDGLLDADDFFEFLDLFASGNPAADLDSNGLLDADDFFGFLALFAAGCP